MTKIYIDFSSLLSLNLSILSECFSQNHFYFFTLQVTSLLLNGIDIILELRSEFLRLPFQFFSHSNSNLSQSVKLYVTKLYDVIWEWESPKDFWICKQFSTQKLAEDSPQKIKIYITKRSATMKSGLPIDDRSELRSSWDVKTIR